MPGRTPAQAVNSYMESIQLAVSCVSYAVVNVGGGYYPADRPHTLRLNEDRPIRLGGPARIWLYFQQYYRVAQSETSGNSWTVAEVGYRYRILDTNHREILAYHWHPIGQSSFISQHLHIGHDAMTAREELHTAHLPTGYVSLPDIIRLLIRDFGATPRRGDWQSIMSG